MHIKANGIRCRSSKQMRPCRDSGNREEHKLVTSVGASRGLECHAMGRDTSSSQRARRTAHCPNRPRSHRRATKLRGSHFGSFCAAMGFAIAIVPNLAAQVQAPARVWMPFSHLGAGVSVGTTGTGFEVAVPYGAYWNIRASVSYLLYSRTVQTSASPVEAHLRLGGARLGVDWFPNAGGFHISLGVLVPNQTQASGRLKLQPGKTLTLEGTDYTADPSNPLQIYGHSEISPVAPLLTVGWGNLIPRDYHKRLTFPMEVGAAYEGAPAVHVSSAGNVCIAGQLEVCTPAASDPEFNNDLNEALRDVNSNLDRYARFFPIVSAGIGYRF
jgi:hypothetical protein